ncbi:hypothetical protein HIM_09209 [Hirsutella minnesotensis 3608]|uniref:Uncharacterized protein n=1 Tax=Hirsutella minnesotensis 3608 TaxID=1043627 RepID=A0A0F7ZGS9_9HYPO|nr:hypothetical protein HIM_09209 [Hirsutella minnesotensis 3608]
MSCSKLPPLRPNQQDQLVLVDHGTNVPLSSPKYVGEPRRRRIRVLSTPKPESKSQSSGSCCCRTAHELWTTDVLELSRKIYRHEAEISHHKGMLHHLTDTLSEHEDMMRNLREENEALRREAHNCREIMNELTAEINLFEIQILRELKDTNATRKLEVVPARSDGALSPPTPVAMEDWDNVVVAEVDDSV